MVKKSRPQPLGYEHVSALRRIANASQLRVALLGDERRDLVEIATQLEAWLDYQRARREAKSAPRPKDEDCPWPGCVFARKHKGGCRTRDGRLGGN